MSTSAIQPSSGWCSAGEGTQGDGDGFGGAGSSDGDRDCLSGFEGGQYGAEVLSAECGLVVDGGDDVACFQSGVGGAATGGEAGDGDACRVAVGVGHTGGVDAERRTVGVGDGAVGGQLPRDVCDD